ncbi:hypothetical protein E1176_04030, partial [Fulvivirga sp. RKSG066]|nr:hypothetical protein [Fulvivirga aurantia]
MTLAILVSPRTITLLWYKYILEAIGALSYTLQSVQASTYHKKEKEVLAEYEIIKKCQQNPEYFAPIYTRYHDQLFLFI